MAVRKQLFITIIIVLSLLSGCSSKSISGVVPIPFELSSYTSKEYNIETCNNEYYQRVINVLDNTFSETSKAYFTGNDWKVVVIDEPLDFGTGYIQSGACDYNNKTITVYALYLENALEHELGHYYMHLYNTNIKNDSDYEKKLFDEESGNITADSTFKTEYVKSSVSEFFAESFRGSDACPKTSDFCSQVKDKVDNFNAVINFYSIEDVGKNFRGLNESNNFLVTSEVDINKLIKLCETMSDEVRGSIEGHYYVLLSTEDIETDNPQYIVINAKLPINQIITHLERKVLK